MGETEKTLAVVVLVLLAGAIGFGIERNYPVETKLEWECREWATNIAKQGAYPGAQPDLSIVPPLIGECLGGSARRR